MTDVSTTRGQVRFAEKALGACTMCKQVARLSCENKKVQNLALGVANAYGGRLYLECIWYLHGAVGRGLRFVSDRWIESWKIAAAMRVAARWWKKRGKRRKLGSCSQMHARAQPVKCNVIVAFSECDTFSAVGFRRAKRLFAHFGGRGTKVGP